MARTPRRGSPAGAAASAGGQAQRVRGNLPRPARPAPSPTPAQPQPVRRRKRSPFGFLSRLTPRFVGDIISELRKVTWPTFAETRYLTVVVAIVALIMGIFLGLIDLFFGWAVERLFF